MEEAEQTKSLVIRVGRRHVAFIDHKTRRKGLEHLIVTEGRWGRGKTENKRWAVLLDGIT